MTTRALTILRTVMPVLLMTLQWADARPITLTAQDGVKVYGEYLPATRPNAPLILAFHQAGSSHVEYAPIAPRLNRAGFSVLAIDQRSGDGEFGGQNRTASALGHTASYDSAMPDLEAALLWGRVQAGRAPLLVWGSSYSAALVFLLVARHPNDVQGLLAFSPGEYLSQPESVKNAAAALKVPTFIDQASDDDELAASRAIFEAVPAQDKTLYVPVHGVHGSATLRPDRNGVGAEENWRAVLNFLRRFKGGG